MQILESSPTAQKACEPVYEHTDDQARHKSYQPFQSRRRAGSTVTELLVAAVLLIGLISVVTPLAVRSGRLWQESRSYQLAINELANEMELLTALDDATRASTLAQWQPSQELLEVLPGARLTGESLDDADGRRLKLTLHWNRPNDAQPLTLVGWLGPP